MLESVESLSMSSSVASDDSVLSDEEESLGVEDESEMVLSTISIVLSLSSSSSQ